MTSTERVKVPVVLADHPLLLSYSVVESPVLSLLIRRDVVEGLGRYAKLLKLENSPDPPTCRLRPRPKSLVPRNSKSRLASTLEICLTLCSNKI